MSVLKIFGAAGFCALLTIVAQAVPQARADDWSYLDDRSTPQKLVQSYYYAISNRFYAQAYSYFQEGSAPKNFDTWVKGYADTGSVEVRFGETAPDPGAGQIHWALPVAIAARKTDGTATVFTGCYTIHMTNLGMQSAPPYQPMGIVSASLRATDQSFGKVSPGPC
ncbi:hypothetical protein WNZ15_25550 [Roseibium sp. AS2]|uniref:hypothetical protein n=1 Tax=Roseibium sp. AS2 TaxID=3135781 RepID=UPI003174FE0C